MTKILLQTNKLKSQQFRAILVEGKRFPDRLLNNGSNDSSLLMDTESSGKNCEKKFLFMWKFDEKIMDDNY